MLNYVQVRWMEGNRGLARYLYTCMKKKLTVTAKSHPWETGLGPIWQKMVPLTSFDCQFGRKDGPALPNHLAENMTLPCQIGPQHYFILAEFNSHACSLSVPAVLIIANVTTRARATILSSIRVVNFTGKCQVCERSDHLIFGTCELYNMANQFRCDTSCNT